MNTFWLKIAGLAVVVVIVLVVAGQFTGGDGDKASGPAPASDSQTPTVYDKFEEDEERLNAPVEAKRTDSQVTEGAVEPNTKPAERTPIAKADQSEESTQPEFVELTEEQKVEADRIWQMVVAERKIGRLPMTSYGNMVRYCRMLIQQFPGSEYDYKARRALGDIPERYRSRYNVTDDEIDMGGFQ